MNKKRVTISLATLLKKGIRTHQPSFIRPMLATLTQDYFSSTQWLYEHKFDGVRCIAIKKDGNVTLYSRNHTNMNATYPEVVAALQEDAADTFIIDGEIEAIGSVEGQSNFQLLQGRMNVRTPALLAARQKTVRIAYRVFDIMYCQGYDVMNLPLIERKAILHEMLHFNRIVTYSKHTIGNGLVAFKKACKLGWEGLIAKKLDAPYLQKRSRTWLKFKCIMQQELVIGGYTQARGSREDFGALLVGYYRDGALIYAGKVGTGFSQEVLRTLGKKMRGLRVKKTPFSHFDEPQENITWIKPVLVGEFQFAQWTQAGKLRVGRYKGLRFDKKAKSVVQELPVAVGLIKK